MSDSNHLTVSGTIATRPSETYRGSNTLYVLLRSGNVVYRVISAGMTLEGFSPGEPQTFTNLRIQQVNGLGQIVARLA